MSGNYSARSNFKIRSRNENIETIFKTNFAGVTISSPNNFHGLDNPASLIFIANGGTVPNDRNFVCDLPITGTDTETGYGPPTGSPMYATTLYGVYLIDYYNGFPTSDMSGVQSSCQISLKDVVIEGVNTKALSFKLLAVNNSVYTAPSSLVGYRQQVWFNLNRNLMLSSDFAQIGFNCFFWVNDLTGKYDTDNRRTTIFDTKNAYITSNDGRLRHIVTIISADSVDAAEFGVPVGTPGWEVIIDSNAGGAGILEEYIRYKNYTVPVPTGEFFEFDVFFKKSASYSDLETGRYTVKIRTAYALTWQIVADLYSTTVAAYEVSHPNKCLFPLAGAPHPQRNIHHSDRTPGAADDDLLNRIFVGQYSKRLNTDFEVMIAKPAFYSGAMDL